MARPVKHKTYHDGSFDKFMIDFKQYLNLELLEKQIVQKGLISEEQFKRILEKPVPLEQKIENVISVVRRKGPDAFVEFAGCIQKCQQTTPDDGNDTILMMLADELTASPDPQAGTELNASTEEYTRMLLEVKEQLSKSSKIDQVKFCLQRAKSISLPLINCINDYQSLFDVLERTHHLHSNDCDILISLAKMLRCPSIVRIVERYNKHCSLVKPPQPLEVPVGHAILSSWIEPVMVTMTMRRVRQIKNVLRQSTKLFRLQDVNFQGYETETNQPWILHWRMTEDNTDSLLNQFSSNPKKFHNEGILKFEKKKMVDILDTSDLERTCEDVAESENPTVMVSDVQPVDSKNSEDLNCRICFGLLTDPQQSACCGQHFCYRCVCELSTPYCPLCKESNFHLFKDISFGRKLKETEVYCVNKKAGCLWQGELGDLQRHLCIKTLDGECKYQPIRCPNFGCNDQVRRLAIKLHISQCPYRPVSCNHCGVTMNQLDLKNHNPCPKMQLQCPNDGCKAKIMHLEFFDHMEACEFIQVDCPIIGCDVHLLKKDFNYHMESYVVKHQLIMNSHLKTLQEKHTVDLEHARETVNMELEGKITMLNKELSDKVEKLQKKVKNLNAEQLKLSNSIDTMKKAEYFVNGLMEIAAKVRAENWRLYLHTIAEFSTQISYAPPTIISLQNYSTKLELSSKPGGFSFRTAQFYSRRGYRMFLNINPSSQGSHRGRYLAVCVHITEGDNDDQLLWPYEGWIKIKLLNQLHDIDHYVYPKEYFLSRNNPNVKYQCIVKPTSGGSNQGWGYTDFILSDNLKKSEKTPHIQYLVNDSLVFEVNAD